MTSRRPPQEDPPSRRELKKGGPRDDTRLLKRLRIAVVVLLVPALGVSGLYCYLAFDPPKGEDAQSVLSSGAPVFFFTLALLWLAVNPPGKR